MKIQIYAEEKIEIPKFKKVVSSFEQIDFDKENQFLEIKLDSDCQKSLSEDVIVSIYINEELTEKRVEFDFIISISTKEDSSPLFLVVESRPEQASILSFFKLPTSRRNFNLKFVVGERKVSCVNIHILKNVKFDGEICSSKMIALFDYNTYTYSPKTAERYWKQCVSLSIFGTYTQPCGDVCNIRMREIVNKLKEIQANGFGVFKNADKNNEIEITGWTQIKEGEPIALNILKSVFKQVNERRVYYSLPILTLDEFKNEKKQSILKLNKDSLKSLQDANNEHYRLDNAKHHYATSDDDDVVTLESLDNLLKEANT